LFNQFYAKYGVKFHFVPMADANAVKELVNENTKVIWVETPTNPMLNVIDIAAMAEVAKSVSAWLVVDNTFATPYLQQPLTMGADMVLHSATKYLGGHSDVVLGAVIVKDQQLADELHFVQNASGGVCGPMDSFLVLRGIKTLHVRMDRHLENAKAIAHFLKSSPKVEKVYWPGFEDHPNHAVAKKQMRGFGGMVSFTLKEGSFEGASKVASALRVFTLAESLGGVESLAGHPASMTHASIPLEERLKTGVVDSLLRLSVGIEDEKDLIADLEQALANV
jgi:cystathionine beta-lyase